MYDIMVVKAYTSFDARFFQIKYRLIALEKYRGYAIIGLCYGARLQLKIQATTRVSWCPQVLRYKVLRLTTSKTNWRRLVEELRIHRTTTLNLIRRIWEGFYEVASNCQLQVCDWIRDLEIQRSSLEIARSLTFTQLLLVPNLRRESWSADYSMLSTVNGSLEPNFWVLARSSCIIWKKNEFNFSLNFSL